ncbi:multidrug resistance efflux pump [Rheinheimera pacifica]|uniref:HlyD family secretion protein n=1 Tax=Rheinheimera pacifica TaxID=173990 RepID=UPI002169BA2B|nr:HlyD family efflux transporter periplasmic adaptor subunit [Rheinheimera pacifica]MCS4307001.1 multidrug resistance efflux pump [Rheinheimera pacifica]
MDVVKQKSAHANYKRKAILLFCIVLVVIVAILLMGKESHRQVNRNQLVLSTVKQGDLRVQVQGYGVLRSHRQKLLTSLTPATVEEIILRPGAQVTPDSIIMKLNNPELHEEAERARMQLSQEAANLRRQELNNQRELLAEESNLAEMTAKFNMVKLRREAEQELVDKGVVSRLTYKTTVLEQEQLYESLRIQQNRIAQLKLVNQEALNIQREQINQAEALYLTVKNRVDALSVKAGINGILQRLPIELGQSIAAGQELALVGSEQDLLALIRVPQAQAEKIQLGQTAEVTTRRELIPGKVSRITPEVQEGTVTVEIQFTAAQLPASARPELNVDAVIYTAELKNTLYIERPVNVRVNSNNNLYKLDPTRQMAEYSAVRYGEDAGKYIQLLEGATVNDTFIVSDMTNFTDSKRISITN